MLVNERIEKEIEKASEEHLYYVMANKALFGLPDNFSTVQYMNSKNIRNQVKFNELLHAKLVQLVDKNGIYLDFGVGPGFLEYVNNNSKQKLHLTTVEWEPQVDCFSSIRKSFDVDVNYLANNILEDDFEIRNCETFYDYVILQRFFPIYKTVDKKRISDVLKKFTPYGKYALVVEADVNWSKSQWDYILSITEKRTKVFGKWNIFKINLEQFK
jgi:hypothetical protein|tara:strand:+ start:45 stop:686 length:642 start_codon:yes stop_codon:yes gene_type:complete